MAQVLKRFKPLFDRVLIQKAVAETKSKGGIVIPEKALGKVIHGTVVAVGPGHRTEDGSFIQPSVNVGDDVLLPEYGGMKVNFENEEFFLYRDSELLGKFDK
ncbi:unnamed protein product [Notodromas monacha]|uniref:10 kDa heat shock protein, mitochondrial n=1 Tax=Notodromas monacha TaxID=399045 RepID=A0A7R9BVA5_9CRUS|nr:unnamed protein product [Notodromas monacha]CAG0922390.1 unnamed protein product [Notodromas monacha]